jgi:hypothetical protein
VDHGQGCVENYQVIYEQKVAKLGKEKEDFTK